FAPHVRNRVERHLPAVKRRQIATQFRRQRMRSLMTGEGEEEDYIPHHAESQQLCIHDQVPSMPQPEQKLAQVRLDLGKIHFSRMNTCSTPRSSARHGQGPAATASRRLLLPDLRAQALLPLPELGRERGAKVLR